LVEVGDASNPTADKEAAAAEDVEDCLDGVRWSVGRTADDEPPPPIFGE
jgi:hypothetical protein